MYKYQLLFFFFNKFRIESFIVCDLSIPTTKLVV